jgi:hypothetical protein
MGLRTSGTVVLRDRRPMNPKTRRPKRPWAHGSTVLQSRRRPLNAGARTRKQAPVRACIPPLVGCHLFGRHVSGNVEPARIPAATFGAAAW